MKGCMKLFMARTSNLGTLCIEFMKALYFWSDLKKYIQANVRYQMKNEMILTII